MMADVSKINGYNVKDANAQAEIENIKNGKTIVQNARVALNANTATNYDTAGGTIKSKFDELEEKIGSGGSLLPAGSTNRPIYINSSGNPATIIVSDSITAAALTSSDTNLATVRDIYYGTPTINDSKAYNSGTSIYAPIVAGTSKSLLVSNGKGAPYWNRNYLSDRTSLYSSSSLSTGNKTLKQSALNFSVIFFSLKGESNSEHYPFWIPRSEYQGRNSTSNKLCLASCEANKNQYINMYYVNDTTFNLSSFEKIITLEIWGIA